MVAVNGKPRNEIVQAMSKEHQQNLCLLPMGYFTAFNILGY